MPKTTEQDRNHRASEHEFPNWNGHSDSNFIIEKSRDIQKQACDEIEAMFLLTLREIEKNSQEGLQTARSAGFFDNDDTSGGDGSRSLQNTPSDENLKTLGKEKIRHSTLTGTEPAIPNSLEISHREKNAPCPESFKTSPRSHSTSSLLTGRDLSTPVGHVGSTTCRRTTSSSTCCQSPCLCERSPSSPSSSIRS
ncbi:unnamed protein product [Bursaphelenchus xylophilus]|uniref:(pine wood nematode) hypothetical protein n=1 Tax=Bursaphelenchus xylophilus TaxID=6326 RepID=A0A7I8X0M3_BURXY|nr:unnamed protein product [Bursaphelenchus xylophilus]CAG9129726.1 unnamed protein product [Bursaphelenchus xylophilus]